MIELKSAVISSQEGHNDKVDLAFNKGISLIEYGQKYIFDFLSLFNINHSKRDNFSSTANASSPARTIMND